MSFSLRSQSVMYRATLQKEKPLQQRVRGTTPRTKGFAKRPWAQPTAQRQCQNLIRSQRRIVRLDNDGRNRYRQNSP